MNRTPGLTPGERIGGTVESLLRKYFTEALNVVSVVVVAIATIPSIAFGPWIWIALGAGILLLAAILRLKGQESLRQLTHERDEALDSLQDATEALRDAITPLAYNLHEYLGLTSHHQRLTVYYHYLNEFRRVARISKNPRFQQSGRWSYSEDQGVIGTVWQQGNALARVGTNETWEDWVRNFGFSDEEAANLTMKSHVIAAVRLEHERELVGIILLESENVKGIQSGQFEKLQNSYITKSIAELLAIAGRYLPIPTPSEPGT